MKRFLLVLVLAFVAPLAAQENTGVIEGTVRRADTGEPLVGVIISLEGSLRQSGIDAVTDSAGRFTLRNVRPGPFVIRASRDGYVAPVQNAAPLREGGAVRRGQLQPGEPFRNADLTLMLGRVLSGRLSDPDGKPVNRMVVRALRIPDNGGAPTEAQKVKTNERGEYRLWGLNAGKYYVTARYETEGYLSSTETDRSSWQETYYPGALAPRGAQVLDVGEAADIDGLDFRVLDVKGFRISGKVTHPTLDLSGEKPTIVLIPRDSRTADERNVQEPGNETWEGFDVRNILPGNYTLLASILKWIPDSVSTRFVVAVGRADVNLFEDISGLTVPLESSGIEVTGNIVSTDNTPWMSGTRSLRVSLHALGDDTRSLPFAMEAANQLWTQTINSTFRLINVPAGRYAVRVSNLPAGEVVREIRVGSTLVANDGFILGEKSPEPLRVIIGAPR
jgi:hypothetical protein